MKLRLARFLGGRGIYWGRAPFTDVNKHGAQSHKDGQEEEKQVVQGAGHVGRAARVQNAHPQPLAGARQSSLRRDHLRPLQTLWRLQTVLKIAK